uniref:Uncharacterized protein n=1 Tax=Kalmanozyma brasiliensis (strain GHG001) TaxID=1365824 RepID=V5ER77_KALBG
MGRDSPRPGSAGLDSGSGHGRASPGLRNAALGSSLRAPSPANVSRAPWAGVKSGLSPNPSSNRVNTLSDFPTAAEAARAKQEQEEKAAAAAAREAARQQAALQALDRFRGASLGSGKHWDEMEDEDGGFLGEVVEFGDGTQYKIPTSNDGSRGNEDDGPPVTKDERFKDVSHDRSWPQRNAARPTPTAPMDRARPPAAATPPAWGPMKNREMAAPAASEPVQAASRPSRSEQRAEKVIIPTTGASVSLRSPIESRDPPGFSYGRERRPGPGAAPYGGRQDQGSGDGHATAQTNRPLPPHLAQNLRPAAAVPAQSADPAGRKTSHSYEETRRPRDPAAQPAAPPVANQPVPHQSQSRPQMGEAGQGRAPWGPKAAAQTRSQPPADAMDSQHQVQAAPERTAAVSEEDVHASIERARKRREEEEQARLAQIERARQKALAIEERIRAAQQQKEAETQREAERRAAEAANATTAVSADVSRKTGPADSAASWRTARPERVAGDNAAPRSRQQQTTTMPTGPTAGPTVTSPLEQNRNGRVVSSQQRPIPEDDRLAIRRDQREQASSPHQQRGANVLDLAATSGLPYGDGQARPRDLASRLGAVEAPKTILARPVKSPPAPQPTETRGHQAAPAQNGIAATQRTVPSVQDRTASKASLSKPRETAAQARLPRASPPAPIKVAEPVLAPVPVRLYPVVRKEALETRSEAAQDAPPAWNRFVVQLKGSRPQPKLNRYQQKQLFARMAAMKAPGRAVYPLTWDPPLVHLSIKTLSRDDQLFPKRFYRGTVIAPVKLPTRVLPRGLPSIVSQIASQGAGSRKQARFDLTPYWSEGQRATGLSNGSATDAQASSTLPASQIQVRLPGHHATVIQPHGTDAMQAALPAANRRAQNFDPTTDAIIGEVLMSGVPQSAYDDRSRTARNATASAAAQAPGSLGPLDYPQNGYSADAFDSHNSAGGYRIKGRSGANNAAVAFYEDRKVNTPSPVSFMVNSEIKADAGGARGSLSPFVIPGSTRASQAQTPASGGSMLPSPSMSTQGTWGQSSLTFPVLETRSSNLADRDHIKSVWSLATNSHAGETQNSLRDIGDDFLPSALPMSVHDLRADDGRARAQREGGDSWASSTFNRYQQYGRSQHEMNSSSRDLSPVTSRSNGFDPTSRSPGLGMDASAAAAARARETGQQYQTASQQASNAYSSLNGGAYGNHQTSSYSPRERQQEGGNGLGSSAFGAYGGGYGSSAAGNVSSMTTDALYAMSSYDRGSMTPNRSSYNQYSSQATSARSAPGSPYSGMRNHAANLGSNVASYSLFPTSASGTSGGKTSGMDGLGVLDDSATFSSNRNQFYNARAYGQNDSPKWPSATTPSVTGSVLRPAASVFNPSKFTAQQRAQQQAQQQQQQQQPIDEYDPTAGASAGPIDQFGAAGYGGFSSSSGLW